MGIVGACGYLLQFKWNQLVIPDVFGVAINALIPRIALVALFLGVGFLAFLESVYLAGQAAEFESASIAKWQLAFRVITFVLLGCSVVFVFL
jgi:hypothetical protein